MQPATSSGAAAGADADNVVAHGFHEEAVGKHVSQTKQRFEWSLSFGESRYVVCFTYSRLSGKRCIFINDSLQHEEKQYRGSDFTHSWSMAGHSMSIMPTWAVKDHVYRSFDLSVDGRPFDTLLAHVAGAEVQLPKLKVEILKAQGLQGNGKTDPYCTCEIPDKFGSKFKTSVSSQTSEPIWNHEHNLADYRPGESLQFMIVDQGSHTWSKSETVLGRVDLQSQQFYPFGFDGILRLSRAGGTKAALRVKITVSDTPEERRLRDIFDRCDADKDGQLNKRELIKALRVDEDVAEFFQLPQQIRQEDGSRDAMERIFQEMDTNDDRQISWAEFKAFFARRPSSWTTSGGTSSCPPTPEMSSASPSTAGKSPRSPAASPMIALPAPVFNIPPDLEGPDGASPPSERKAKAKSRDTSPRLNSSQAGASPTEIGMLEVRPKATMSRRKLAEGGDTRVEKSSKGSEKSPNTRSRSQGTKCSTSSFASAFSDLADFGGFASSPASTGASPDSPWGTFPTVGDPAVHASFTSCGSPAQESTTATADSPPAQPAAWVSPDSWPASCGGSPNGQKSPGTPARVRANSEPLFPNSYSPESQALAPRGPPAPPSFPASQQAAKTRSLTPRSRAATTAEGSPSSSNLVDPWGKAYCPSVHNAGLIDPWGYKYAK